MNKNEFNIESFDDLKFAQEQIRNDNRRIEQSFKENPFVKFSSSILGGESVKDVFTNNLGGGKKSGFKIIQSLLLANKATRKYFIAYTIAKEMVPYTMYKVSELFKKQ